MDLYIASSKVGGKGTSDCTFKPPRNSKTEAVTPTGFEPVITGMKALCPRPLDEGAVLKLYHSAPQIIYSLLRIFARISFAASRPPRPNARPAANATDATTPANNILIKSLAIPS